MNAFRENWAVFAPKDQTGVGRMADDMISVLGVGRRLIADSYHMERGNPEGPFETAVGRSAGRKEVEQILDGLGNLQGVFFFERLDWNFEFFRECKRRGIAVICIPMWEWFAFGPAQRPLWRELVDLFICPNEMCERVLRGFGIRNAVRLPWCLDLDKLPRRIVEGPARVFIHNAGLVDGQDRKGTRDVIQAFKRVRRRDIRLVVRLQRPAELPEPDERIELRVGSVPHPYQLYEAGDVAIQPSKMEGIGFMVLEPVACGLPTITLDYPPMNEAVRHPEMLVRKKWFKRRAVPSEWVRHAHLRLTSLHDLAARIEWCASSDLGRISRDNRRWAESEFDRAALLRRWTEAVSCVLPRKVDG